MAKHYIITDESGRVLRGFSDDFEQPDASAICICEDGGRHFELNGIINPPTMDLQGRYRYKLVDGAVVERTQEELEEVPILVVPPTTEDQLRADVDYLAMIMEVNL